MTGCISCGSQHVRYLRDVHDMLFDIPGVFQLEECLNCGLVYLANPPQPAEIVRYYPVQYQPYRHAIQDENSAWMRWARTRNILKRVHLVQQHCRPGAILDVGCSTGIFLHAMVESGWKGQGVEISPEAARYAHERFGLDVMTGDFESMQLPASSFHAVTMWDVLEHTFDPLNALKKVNSLLKDQGIVLLTIPHWESLDHRLFQEQWIGFDVPRHLFMFRQPVLERLFQQAGFSVVRSFCGLGGYYTFLASFRLWSRENHRLAWADSFLRFPGLRFPFQPFFSLVDRLGKGGTLIMVAKKESSL